MGGGIILSLAQKLQWFHITDRIEANAFLWLGRSRSSTLNFSTPSSSTVSFHGTHSGAILDFSVFLQSDFLCSSAWFLIWTLGISHKTQFNCYHVIKAFLCIITSLPAISFSFHWADMTCFYFLHGIYGIFPYITEILHRERWWLNFISPSSSSYCW